MYQLYCVTKRYTEKDRMVERIEAELCKLEFPGSKLGVYVKCGFSPYSFLFPFYIVIVFI